MECFTLVVHWSTAIRGIPVVIHASRVIGVGVMVDGRSTFIFRYEVLDFPVVLFDTNGKLKILFCDRVPILRRSQSNSIREVFGNRNGTMGGNESVPYKPS